MRFFRTPPAGVAYLLGVLTLLGLAAPARAVQYLLTFEGPTRVNAVCNSGPNGVGGGCVDLRSENVRWTFLLDFARLGEEIVLAPSGAETIKLLNGTFFADFLGDPVFENTGPSESRVTRISRIGTQPIPPLRSELTNTEDVEAFPVFTGSHVFLTGLVPEAGFALGSPFDGHQEEIIVDASALVKEHRIVIDADLTLTEIRLPEPGMLLLLSVSLVILVWMSSYMRGLRFPSKRAE